jgi:hypothetical protein
MERKRENKTSVIDLSRNAPTVGVHAGNGNGTLGTGISRKQEEWECDSCTLLNPAIQSRCVVCRSWKPHLLNKSGSDRGKENSFSIKADRIRRQRSQRKCTDEHNCTRTTYPKRGQTKQPKQRTLLGDIAPAKDVPNIRQDPYANCVYILGPTKPMKQTTLLDSYSLLPARNGGSSRSRT